MCTCAHYAYVCLRYTVYVSMCAGVHVRRCALTRARTRVRAYSRAYSRAYAPPCARAPRPPGVSRDVGSVSPCGAEANVPLIAAVSAAPAEPCQLQPPVWQLLGSGLHFFRVGFEVLSPLV